MASAKLGREIIREIAHPSLDGSDEYALALGRRASCLSAMIVE